MPLGGYDILGRIGHTGGLLTGTPIAPHYILAACVAGCAAGTVAGIRDHAWVAIDRTLARTLERGQGWPGSQADAPGVPLILVTHERGYILG